ncbi:MAG: hypothetical protein R3247_04540 [Rhodothermales bacterium]|nr:hypothetical protein [Rhodothermales bacterium]
MPAWLVFGVSTLLSAGAAGLVYLRGAPYLPLSILAVVLLLAVLILDERGGFTRSRRMRRSGEVRVTFTQAEVAVLFVLLLLCTFVSLQAWVK